MVSKLGLLWTNHFSLFSLSFFLSVEMVIHHTHPEPLLCAGYTLGVLFVTVNAALPFSQLWAVSPLGPMHLPTLRTVGSLWRTGLQVRAPGEAFCIPLPAPFLGPVGENPAFRVFSAPPHACIKHELWARVWVRCPSGDICRMQALLRESPGRRWT